MNEANQRHDLLLNGRESNRSRLTIIYSPFRFIPKIRSRGRNVYRAKSLRTRAYEY